MKNSQSRLKNYQPTKKNEVWCKPCQNCREQEAFYWKQSWTSEKTVHTFCDVCGHEDNNVDKKNIKNHKKANLKKEV